MIVTFDLFSALLDTRTGASRAFSAITLRSPANSEMFLVLTSLTTGTSRPRSVSTATPTWK